jgi:hypothetical protein
VTHIDYHPPCSAFEVRHWGIFVVREHDGFGVAHLVFQGKVCKGVCIIEVYKGVCIKVYKGVCKGVCIEVCKGVCIEVYKGVYQSV